MSADVIPLFPENEAIADTDGMSDRERQTLAIRALKIASRLPPDLLRAWLTIGESRLEPGEIA